MGKFSSMFDIPCWEWDEGDRLSVQEALSDPGADPGDRADAAELCGDLVLISDDMARIMLGVLQNPAEDEILRGRIAIAFGPGLESAELDALDDDPIEDLTDLSAAMAETVQKALKSLYFDGTAPKEVRRRCLEASVRATQDWHRGAVRAAYHDGDALWRLTAVFCMAYVDGFDDLLLEALGSDDPVLLSQAIQSAGDVGLNAAWPHIEAILTRRDADREVLFAAIDASARIRPAEAGALLHPFLESDDQELSEAASEALNEAEANCRDFLDGEIDGWESGEGGDWDDIWGLGEEDAEGEGGPTGKPRSKPGNTPKKPGPAKAKKTSKKKKPKNKKKGKKK